MMVVLMFSVDSRNQLRLESGILLAVPIPGEYHKQGLKTESVIEEALKEAREKNILGRDVTPFVLKRVQELSDGAALEANIGLLLNNARVGSQIAVALNRLNSSGPGPISSRTLRSPVKHEARNVISSSRGRPVVIGGSVLDIHVKALEDVKRLANTIYGEERKKDAIRSRILILAAFTGDSWS
ncbi:Pseudouridine-5'-phosphate glycosidase [Araneus ventricosus]|uniref:Pseudouridine-5'-phosphate glycosidase n=1 Tax=Araneus ventricosus TaxID=182803 RepID=A0A4Y2HN60_ARAVE|nr:Pseudouridine-5'-phosphate glycosidase [Araneus ventricosus]